MALFSGYLFCRNAYRSLLLTDLVKIDQVIPPSHAFAALEDTKDVKEVEELQSWLKSYSHVHFLISNTTPIRGKISPKK